MNRAGQHFLDEIAGMIAKRKLRMKEIVKELNSLEGEIAALEHAQALKARR